MSTLTKSPSYVGKTSLTYLNEILVNVDVIDALGQQTDDSGCSIDWANSTGNWLTVAQGIQQLCQDMDSKKIGIYNPSTYIFTFKIMYYNKYQVTASINLCTLNISKFFDGTNFGSVGGQDSDRLEDLYAIRKNVDECNAVLGVLASTDN